ncbi:MAG: deoxyribonuclease V [candidate division WOR-3 bacterium]
MEIANLIQEQERLRKKVSLKNEFKKLVIIAGADCAFDEENIYCALALFSFPEIKPIEIKTSRVKLRFPYIPGFLSYREKGAYLKTYKKLKNKPDVILFDGQGISHPRGFGLASHLGVLLDKPTIGCAKSRLVGEYKMPDKSRGSFSPLIYQDEIVGYVLRTQNDVAPLFVSPGYKIDFATTKEIILKSAIKYRLPEPLRIAHIISQSLKRKGGR